MSRAKKSVKKNAWEDLPLLDRWRLAHYGELATVNNGEDWQKAASIISALEEAIFFEQGFEAANQAGGWPGCGDAATFEKIGARRHRMAWKKLVSAFRNAVEKKDGAVFAMIAGIISKKENPVEPLTEFVARRLYQKWLQRRAPGTVQEMVNALKCASIPSSFNTVKRIFGYFAVTPSSGQRGAPKGKPHKRIR